MFNVMHQLHESTFLVCKNEFNKAVSDSDSFILMSFIDYFDKWQK